MHHAEILIGHFRETVRNWPVASSYFTLCIMCTLHVQVYSCVGHL